MDTQQPAKAIKKSAPTNKELFSVIGQKIFHFENAYLVRRELYLHFNKAVSPDASAAYVKVINSFGGFFQPVMEATLAYSIVSLSALVSGNDRESLEKLINKMQAVGEADFRNDLTGLRTKHAKILRSITDMRMEHFAHLGGIDLNSVIPISDDDYIKLFDDLKVLINKIGAVYGETIWYMDEGARESIKDTHDLMDNLLRGEAQRLSEIDTEYISGVFGDGRSKWLKANDEETQAAS